MRRATTPTHTFTFPDEVKITTIVDVEIIYSQNGVTLLNKNLSDLTIDEENNSLYFALTQEETNNFAPGKALIQLRAKNSNGAVLASQMIWLTVKPVLDSEEM